MVLEDRQTVLQLPNATLYFLSVVAVSKLCCERFADVWLYPNDSCGTYCHSMEPSLIIPVKNLDDLKTFEGQWTVYLEAGAKTDTIDPVQNKMYKHFKG